MNPDAAGQAEGAEMPARGPDDLSVTWEGGAATAVVEGPAQPAATDVPRNISSSWFRLLR